MPHTHHENPLEVPSISSFRLIERNDKDPDEAAVLDFQAHVVCIIGFTIRRPKHGETCEHCGDIHPIPESHVFTKVQPEAQVDFAIQVHEASLRFLARALLQEHEAGRPPTPLPLALGFEVTPYVKSLLGE